MRMRLLLMLLAAWLVILLVLVAASFFQPTAGGGGGGGANPGGGSGGLTVSEEQQLSKRLSHAFRDLDLLKRQNAELRILFGDVALKDPSRQEQQDAMFAELRERLKKAEALLQSSQTHAHSEDDFAVVPKEEPSTEYEQTRRRLENGVREMWYFFSAELRKMQKAAQGAPMSSSQLATKISNILEQGVEHKRSLLQSAEQLARVDGYAEWRQREAQQLGDLVQRRLHHLQNPNDCATARKLVCSLNKGCGYGCQIHHVVYCFIVAYGTQRTLILKSKGWRYHKAGWEEVFLPVSDTCVDPGGATHSQWPGKSSTQVVDLPIIDSLSPRPPWLPLAVPRDLAPRLSRLHGDPIVWWVGQFLRYLLRPQQAISRMLDDSAAKLGFQKPIVGVHIRRTDKVGTEAAFHPLEEYMQVVEEYYAQLELTQPVDKRRVYLASDDPSVLADARKKYPNYDILGDQNIAKTAAVSTRYSDNSLFGVIIDIHFLSLTDYLVCTFSSQVCRIAYEIMQELHPDASAQFRSLDDIYYYGGQSAHNREAVLEHRAQRPEEIDLKIGDVVGVAGNHWDGFSKGKNTRTGRSGLYPSHKVVEKMELADFPTYPEAEGKAPAPVWPKEQEANEVHGGIIGGDDLAGK